ncbi:MAG: TonB-dependent receptor, partial [Chitinophagales bacterium]
SDALAGVVNFIPTPPAPDGKVTGEVGSDYQANNGQIGATGMLSGNKNGFYWLGRVSHKEAKNYQDPIDGRVYGTNYNETDATGSFGLNKKWGFAHLDLTLFNNLQAIPDGSRDSVTRQFTKQITEADTFRPVVPNSELNTYKIPVLHQHIQHYRVLSSSSFDVWNGRLIVDAGFERSVRREFSHPEDPDVAGLYLQLNSYTYNLKYHLNSIYGWEFTFGLNGMYQANDVAKGTDFIIPSYHQFDIGPFVVFKKNIGKLDIAGGIRFDSRTFNNDALFVDTTARLPIAVGNNFTGADKIFTDYNHTFSGMSYSLGLTYILSKQVALKANIARGFRAPNIVEISANGVHPGTAIYQLGNDNFKPEFSLQEDIGMEFASDHLSINVSVFNNDIANYIYNQKVLTARGKDSIIVQGNQTYQFRASSARLYGGEASIDIHPHPLDWLHFENSISVVYALNEGGNGIKITDSNRYLPFIPPLHGVSELRANFKHPAKYLQNTFIKVQLVIYAKQDRAYLENNTETPTPGYTLFNAGIGSDIISHSGKTIFNIALFANNLFDVAYQDHLSRLKYFEEYPTDPRGRPGIYNMGRNIGIKLSVPFNLK